MAVDVKQQLEKITMLEVLDGISPINDVVEYLSENKVITTSEMTVKRFVAKDGNVVTTADAYGYMAAAHNANYNDRTYLSDEYTMPLSDGISFTVSRDQLHIFGLNEDMAKGTTRIDESLMVSIGEKFIPEIARLVQKIRSKRRAEVRELLTELQAPSKTWQKPLGLNPVALAASRTTGAWGYTNMLGEAALTTDSFKKAVNIFASDQINSEGQDYMVSKPIMLLHASDFSLAESIMLPHLSVNILNRTAGDSILPERLNIKSVGVYGDTTNADDFVVLGENHTIYRMAFVTPTNKDGRGISVSVEWIPAIEANASSVEAKKESGLRITVYDRSIMVVDSAIDIVKNVAP